MWDAPTSSLLPCPGKTDQPFRYISLSCLRGNVINYPEWESYDYRLSLSAISLQQKEHAMKIVREHTSRIDDSENATPTMTVVCFDMEHLKDLPIVTDPSLGAPNIDTYKKLTSCTDEEFNAIMRPANEFLSTLSDDGPSCSCDITRMRYLFLLQSRLKTVRHSSLISPRNSNKNYR